MRTSARIAAAVLTTTIVVGGTATSASAQTQTVKDKSADVISYADDGPDTQGTVLSRSASAASGADIRSMKVDHGKKNVVVTVKLAQLKRATFVSIAFRPPGKSQPNRYLVNTGRKSGEVYNGGDKVICAVPLTTRLGKNGYVKATIKRSCLGNPKSIRVTAGTSIGAADGSVQYDSLSKNKVFGVTYTKALKAS